MLRSLPLLVIIALFCSFFSCKKDPLPTIVKGTVVDSKTGEPIPNATVEFYNYLPSRDGQYNEAIPEYASSNAQGNFNYTVRKDAKYASIYSAFGDTYTYIRKRLDYEPYKITMESTNQFTIPLIRYNAAIRLHIKNETEQDGNVYLVISNPTSLAEARTSWGVIKFSPLKINQGEETTYVFPTVANEYTTIYWGGVNFSDNAPPFSDSLFLYVGDTLNYSILF
ncbi:MAG: hypothetical protein IT262_14935 [Saprospiraceae bacterium]|nr:hypothetical protein [Saprospiraceae bacterium]